MIQIVAQPLINIILGAVKPGRLRWAGPWLPRLPIDWQDAWRDMRPRKIRWAWALLLAVALVILIGECSPAASSIAALP